MINRLPLLAVLAVSSFPASAAPNVSRNVGVNGFERIRVDGPYEVQLKTGVPPSAKITGRNQSSLDGVSIKVEGKTLIIRKDPNRWGGYSGEADGPVVIDLGTHELGNAWLNGAGSLSIDKVRGLSFVLNVQGAGTARIGQVDVDQFQVTVVGSGTARVAGKTLKTTATARGSANLDGGSLSAKDAAIIAEGPSLVSLNVSETAKISASGVTAVTLSGDPSCTVKAQGSAHVEGCKASN